MTTAAPARRHDLRQARLELDRPTYVSLFVSPEGWPSHVADRDRVPSCGLCAAAADEGPLGSPGLSLSYWEETDGRDVSWSWVEFLCSDCDDGFTVDGSPSLSEAARVYRMATHEFLAARRPFPGIDVAGRPVITAAKLAQKDCAAAYLVALVAPVLDALGADRESVRLALAAVPGVSATVRSRTLDALPQREGR